MRFADGVKVYQIHRPAHPLRQLVHQRQFLTGREAAPHVYRQVQIAFHLLPTGSQRTEQNGQSDPRLCVESGQDRSCEILVMR
jgi:hypothetical protein